MPPTPEETTAKMIANLKTTTGKPIEDWRKLLAKQNFAKHGPIVTWLKSEHGVGHGYANLIAHESLKVASGAPEASGNDLVAAQYDGAKAAVRPIYDTLIREIAKFGPDVEVSPKKTYVSLRRSKQFALIQPSTATRVDVGINLKGQSSTARLEPSGSFNAMVSHRVRVADLREVDKELVAWLRKAYDAG